MSATTGIRQRHGNRCATRGGGRCGCPWEASVYSRRDGRKVRKTFPSRAAAKAWRDDAASQLRRGTMRAPTSVTLDAAARAWRDGARSGQIRNRSGDTYKPSAVRGYEQALRLRVLPDLGARKLSEIGFIELQDLVDRLVADGWSASTVQCAVIPLRAIYARALGRGEVAVNPTRGLKMPAVRSGRDRFASPAEAAALLAALPDDDRALWATALYAGLRRGELQALRWENVDLKANLLHVERSWDAKEGVVLPKSSKGRRTVPVARVVREDLLAHRMRTIGDGLVFGRGDISPFAPGAVTKRADQAWKNAGLDRITLHECRHTYASLMIAAGANAKALSTYMGHANISITLDRYGHLMPGNEDQAAALLDAYLDQAASSSGGG